MTMSDVHRDLFYELCVQLGFCSLSIEGEDEVISRIPFGVEEAARAVFAGEGLDYDTYERPGVKAAVRECISRHLNLETRP